MPGIRLRLLPSWAAFLLFLLLLTSPFEAVSAQGSVDCTAEEVITSGPSVAFTSLPQHCHFYPRDASDQALIAIAGTISTVGYDIMRLKVYSRAENPLAITLLDTYDVSLSYTAGEAVFSFPSYTIVANTSHGYDFEVYAVANSVETLVASANDVVTGDVFLVQGQSNASAAHDPDGLLDLGLNPPGLVLVNDLFGAANQNQRQFIRSFGTASIYYLDVESDTNWYYADGDSRNEAASIGQWPMTLAASIIDNQSIPVAILNGSQGRAEASWPNPAISAFVRNDADPASTLGNYGRLLWRFQQAGIADAVRAIFWYQGESGEYIGSLYQASFEELYNDWAEDYPNAEYVYIHQTRFAPYDSVEGIEVCVGSVAEVMTIAETLRSLPETIGPSAYAPLKLMSSNGLDGHAACHYVYNNGYQTIGDNFYRQIARDLFEEPGQTDIDPPNLDFSQFSTPTKTEITIVTRNQDDTLIWDPEGAEAPPISRSPSDDFVLGGATVADILSGSTTENTVTLNLSQSAATANQISYRGHWGTWQEDQGPEPWITNLNGVGLLTFYNNPILPYPQAVPISISAIGNDARLTWAHTADEEGNRTYEVWHSHSPYFEPNLGEGTSEDLAPPDVGEDAIYDAVDAVIDSSENDFFLVRGRSTQREQPLCLL